MTSYESIFLQAEAVARGWLTSASTDQELYELGIIESNLTYEVDTTDIALYYTQPGIDYTETVTVDDKVKYIVTQKWVAICGNQNIEAWTEWRRTGAPTFFKQSVVSNIGAGRFPQRLFYPSDELKRNPNFPGQKMIYDKVWWDVN